MPLDPQTVTQRFQAKIPYAAAPFLAAIVESSEDAILTKTLGGVITSWNPAAERMYGYTAQEAIGQPITFLVPPERRQEIQQILERIACGERVRHFETDRVRKDGRTIRVSVTISPICNEQGEVLGASAIARDITERQRADEFVKGQVRILELIAKNAPLEKVLTRIVESLEALSYEELIGSILLLDGDRRLRLGAAPSLPEAYNQAIDGIEIGPEVGSCGTAAYRGETVIAADVAVDPLWRDFRDLAIEHGLRACWSIPIFSPQGDVLGTFASYYRAPREPSADDLALLSVFSRSAAIAITRHRAEEKLRRQTQELAKANQRKNDFLAVLAHEMRNPLGAISNALALAEASTDPGVLDDAVGILRRQTDQLTRLVDDLLDLSRIGRGLIELEHARLDLRQIAERAVESLRPRLETRSQRLEIDFGSEPLELDGDPVRLGQVITNLLSNAARYSDEGCRIWLTTRRAGDGLMIEVRDEGQGIDAEFLPRIFELFTQGPASSRSRAGLGIGLTLVHQLVELHGGRVEAASDGVGQGSTFRVWLPGADGEARQPDPPQAEADEPERPMRVLLVDDHQEALIALETLLKLWGHDVRTAFDGHAALEVAREHRPELILLDIGLPEMDGWEVARRLRRDPATADVTLVALTGFGQEADRARSRQAGFDHHLVKPVKPQELRDHLAEWTRAASP